MNTFVPDAEVVTVSRLNSMFCKKDKHGKEIELPAVQRNFVWSPNQIEDLWDSILRGYTIGAFTVYRNTNLYELLDGQQRATAIVLAFPQIQTVYNNATKVEPSRYKVFIDLLKPPTSDARQFFLRVTTNSHPWGYSLTNNREKLNSAQRWNSLNSFNLAAGEQYFQAFCKDPWSYRFLPYSSLRPIPLHLFLHEDSSLLEVKERVLEWQSKSNYAARLEPSENDPLHHEINRLKEYFLKMDGLRTSESELDYYSIADIYDVVQESVFRRNNLALLFPSVMNRPEPDKDIENMFVRINTAGTPIGGEELNYSLLKSRASANPSLINDLEKACNNIIAPARFITISYRLFTARQRGERAEQHGMASTVNIDLKIRPAQFARDMNDNKKREDFISFLRQDMLDRKRLDAYQTLMRYGEDNRNGLPPVLFRKLGRQAPEIVFMLLYRIIEMGDIFDAESRNRTLAFCLSLFFLGRSQKRSSYRNIVNAVMPCMVRFKQDEFWHRQTLERAAALADTGFEDGFYIPAPHDLDYYKDITPKKRNYNIPQFVTAAIFNNRDFLIYAERELLNECFHKSVWDMEDSNLPYDLDHILPESYIRYARGVSQPLRDIYHTNGNLRTWPLELNRKDQDTGPRYKFDPLNPENFSNDSDEVNRQRLVEERDFWALRKPFAIDGRLNPSEARNLLRKTIIKFSLYSEMWLAQCRDIVDKNSLKKSYTNAITCILHRNADIYRRWHQDLGIADISPKDTDLSLKIFIRHMKNLSVRIAEPKDSDEAWNTFLDENGDHYQIGELFYITYYTATDEGGTESLKQDGVVFSIKLTKQEDEECSKINKQLSENGIYRCDSGLYTEFVLTSSSQCAAEYLHQDIVQWLKKVDSLAPVERNFVEIFPPYQHQSQ